MKKIGVLTLPTLTNYGGILQAYALVYTLRKLGYDAWLVNRRWNSENNNLLHRIKKFIYHQVVIRKFDKFVEKYIVPRTSEIDTRSKMDGIRKEGFVGYVVGSDQVWRVKNVRGADYNFFLDFTKDDAVKRISYAASFGVDYWDDNQDASKSIKEVKPLLEKFDAISVREDSGVRICNEVFGVPAVHVLDPTLLVNKEEYIANFKLKDVSDKYLAVYILDMTLEKVRIISKVSEELHLPVKYINQPKKVLGWMPKSISEIVKPGVKHWMQSILEAQFVLTDSFHGMAFSILFEKQFLVIGNESRGLTRFTSLLAALGLTSRKISPETTDFSMCTSEKINYFEIGKYLKKNRSKAFSFLIHNL